MVFPSALSKTSQIALLAAAAIMASAHAAYAQMPYPVPRPANLEAAQRAAPSVSASRKVAAKQLFGAARLPDNLAPQAIGFYNKGCLAGGQPLAINGPNWQVMRLSRNRNWGHPVLISMLEELAGKVAAQTKWPGLLVGDLAQPRGGPMLTGHASHQIGLDADIWLNPMPTRTLSAREREDISARTMANAKFTDIGKEWTSEHVTVIRLAATMPGVERVLVNPVIKKALCREARGDRSWLARVRPYWGHHYHMHVRMKCPAGSSLCTPQAPVGTDEECGAPLDAWMKQVRVPDVPPPPPKTPPKPKPPLLLADLPQECRAVLEAPENPALAASRQTP